MNPKMVFKLEKEPAGFNQVFAKDCKFKIKNTDGLLYLNYEKRAERVVGSYKNLKQDGEIFLADIRLHKQVQQVEDRLEYAIEGKILSKNSDGEVDSVEITGLAAIMENKF